MPTSSSQISTKSLPFQIDSLDVRHDNHVNLKKAKRKANIIGIYFGEHQVKHAIKSSQKYEAEIELKRKKKCLAQESHICKVYFL